MKVLIGGGTGFIGRYLRQKLVNRGHKVIVISRKTVPGDDLMTWNDIDRNGLPVDTDAVVNLAGKNILDKPFERWTPDVTEELRDSRIETTRTLIRAMKAAKTPPKVFVGGSAIGIYPANDTAEYTEESEVHPSDFLTQLCHDWEAASEDCPTRRVIVRTGLVLGREAGVIANMYWPFFFNLGGPIGSGKQWFPWIHVQDIAGIFTHAIENEHVCGILNGTSPNPVTNAEFSKAFAKAMWRLALFPLPAFVLNTVYGEDRAQMMLTGQKVLPKRTQELGYQYQYADIHSACKECSHLVSYSNMYAMNK